MNQRPWAACLLLPALGLLLSAIGLLLRGWLGDGQVLIRALGWRFESGLWLVLVLGGLSWLLLAAGSLALVTLAQWLWPPWRTERQQAKQQAAAQAGLHLGWQQWQQGQWADAERTWLRVANFHPQPDLLWALAAQAAEQGGAADRALLYRGRMGEVTPLKG